MLIAHKTSLVLTTKKKKTLLKCKCLVWLRLIYIWMISHIIGFTNTHNLKGITLQSDSRYNDWMSNLQFPAPWDYKDKSQLPSKTHLNKIYLSFHYIHLFHVNKLSCPAGCSWWSIQCFKVIHASFHLQRMQEWNSTGWTHQFRMTFRGQRFYYVFLWHMP